MIPLLKRQQVLFLLETGLSIRIVAARMQISRDTVSSIKKKFKGERCTDPCIKCQQPKVPVKEKKIMKIALNDLMKAYIAEAPEIFRIVDDLQSLHKLGLINHKLFVDLGERAKKSFNRIFLPTGGKNAKKKEAAK